ncbi:MAG TPA: dihydropyrimidinase [Chloroflexi bacterium]|nr:dihydropyrimidinase [Chloroflexota bacterium]
MQKIIKNGTLITASDTFQADILIEGEQIKAIGADLHSPGLEVIDATGKLILPGGVDPHTHFDLPMFGTVSSDDHYTGHKAAAFGGTTTVMDFVPQTGDDAGGLQADLAAWRAKADPKAAIDFGFHMNITHFDEKIAAEIPFLVEVGITTLKVFTAYNHRLRLGDGEIFQVMRIAKEHGMLTMLHAENGDIIEVLVAEALAAGHTAPEWHARTRPAWGAVESALRAFSIAAQTEAPLYLVHMNAGGEVDMLHYARERGLPVMGETCPQYLFFSEDDLRRPDGAKWICSPPMRSAADNARLWEGLEDSIIQTVGTDHCPFFFDGTQPIIYEGQPIAIPGKELGAADFTKIPNGLPGVGDRLPVLWSTAVNPGRLTPNQFVALTSTNPAKIFGLYPRKGALVPGADADLVIWDPQRKVKFGVAMSQQRTDYNLYEGWELTGYPEKVFLRGHLIVDGEQWLGQPGMGQFLKRKPGAEVL